MFNQNTIKKKNYTSLLKMLMSEEIEDWGKCDLCKRLPRCNP